MRCKRNVRKSQRCIVADSRYIGLTSQKPNAELVSRGMLAAVHA